MLPTAPIMSAIHGGIRTMLIGGITAIRHAPKASSGYVINAAKIHPQ